MDRLSINFRDWRAKLQEDSGPKLDAVVIGSGYGGSVAALRLRERGYGVTVLERGSEFLPGDFPSDVSELPEFVRARSPVGGNLTGRATGLFEWRTGPGVISLVANGVGGGSLINAGVLRRPDPDVFRQAEWPHVIRTGALASHPPGAGASAQQALEHWLAQAERNLCGRRAPCTTKTRAFKHLTEHMPDNVGQPRPHVEPVEATIDPDRCIGCGDCATGCNVEGAKQTLRETYLKSAVAAGAEIVHGATVWTIAPVRTSTGAAEDPYAPADAWRLRVFETNAASRWLQPEHAASEEGFDVCASLIVLAAGTFGTTELLQRSRDRTGKRFWLPRALGARFSANGDSINFVCDAATHVNAIGVGSDLYLGNKEVGPTITSQINVRWTGERPWCTRRRQPEVVPFQRRVTIQDGAIPGALARLFCEALSTGLTLSRLERWCGEPASPGAGSRDPLSASHERRGGQEREQNEQALARRTHVILAMGHDESRGRIRWDASLDASVPCWDAPERVETYAVQAELLRKTARKLKGEWVPNPAWRPFPETVTRVMSGPKPAPRITTVHPLGGCVMGDDPATSVVDHLGRLWRSDQREHASGPDTWARHENFIIVDGSIVPTALGVNPMLTITALAERAMDALPKRNRSHRGKSAGGSAGVPLTHMIEPAATEDASPAATTNGGVSVGAHLARGQASPEFLAAPVPSRDEPAGDPYGSGVQTTRQARSWPMALIPAIRQGLTKALRRPAIRQGLTKALRRPAPQRPPRTARKPRTAKPGHRPSLLQRTTDPQPWRATMRERLVCERMRVRGALARAFGSPDVQAVLELEIGAGDWLAAWDSVDHVLDRVGGTLRFQRRSQAGDTPAGAADESASGYLVATYRRESATPAKRAPITLFTRVRSLLPLPPVCRWLRTGLTYVVLRSDIFGRAADRRETNAERFKRVRLGIQQIAPLMETRQARYDLVFTLDKDRTDVHGLPEELTLRGDKRVSYAATLCEFIVWAAQHLRRAFSPGHRVRPLRETFFEQAGHLNVHLTGDGVDVQTRFLMDFTAWLRRAPVTLDNGDLTGGVLALLAYPAFLARYLIKTRLPDFRLPDYRRGPLPALPKDGRALRCGGNDLEVPAQFFPLRVLRGVSSSDGADANSKETIELMLTRYACANAQGRPEYKVATWYGRTIKRVKSVLLIHGFAQSGYLFTLDTLPENLAGRLHEEGFDVWVLDYRLSTRQACHRRSSSLDQIAEHDVPAAVEKILSVLAPEVGGGELQIHAFAQCLGGVALTMSMLSGKLHHDAHAVPADAAVQPRCPKLASVMLSQTHPRCIAQPGAQARTWIPAIARDGLRRKTIPFSADGAAASEMSLVDAWMDRLFAALPVPHEERCPASKHEDEDDRVTCRRVRFLEAPLFKHGNLNPETHRRLPYHFGHANVGTFAHAAKCVEAERLVDEDGRAVYVNEANVRAFAALPIAFLHGAENELFHPESARSSATLFRRIHPDWAGLACRALGSRAEDGLPCWIVEGHGHLDILIGEKAPCIYHGIARFFADCQLGGSIHQARAVSPTHATARVPRCGPFIRPPRMHEGTIRIGVSFLIDDRFAEGKESSDGRVGNRTWAFARTRCGKHSRTHRLQLLARSPSPRGLASQAKIGSHDDFPSYRFAAGELVIEPGLEGDLTIEAFSIHESLAQEPSSDMCELDALLADGGQRLPDSWTTGEGGFGDFDAWLDRVVGERDGRLRTLAESAELPIPQSVSRFRMAVERPEHRTAIVPARSLRACAAPDHGGSEVSLLAGCCRYPGFPFDRHRADHAVQRVFSRQDGATNAEFALWLGDAIYADATAGIVDPLSPTERFVDRHVRALQRGERDNEPTFGDLLAKVPSVMVPDDHEYIDSYPAGRPLVMAGPARVKHYQAVAKRAATDAYRYFQTLPFVQKHGVYTFTSGPVRVLALDTRSERKLSPRRILIDEQRDAITAWLNDAESSRRLNILATGSVVLPGIRKDVDPANPAEHDNFQFADKDRAWLLAQLATAWRRRPSEFRFVLLAGDYHLMHASRVHVGDAAVGLAVVAPPMYAPMPYVNARPSDLAFDPAEEKPQPARTDPFRLDQSATWEGSGIARLQVERVQGGGARYRIELAADLLDYGRRAAVVGKHAAGNPTHLPKSFML